MSGVDDKENVSEIENSPARDIEDGRLDKTIPPEEDAKGQSRGLQPPEFVANLTPEERAALETKLKRKIDIRLMPAIILMYILNYIDR